MFRLSLFTLLLAFSAKGQITITSTSYPIPGDGVRTSSADVNGIDYTTTGQNAYWDYSFLYANDQEVVQYYGPSDLSGFTAFIYGATAPLNYKTTTFHESKDIPFAQFSQFLPVNIEKLEIYDRLTADSLTSVGLSLTVDGTNIPFRSDTIDKVYQYPMNFGNVWSSRSYTNMDLNPFQEIIFRQHKQRYSEVDGYGLIVTPYNVFNALRVHHTIDEQDSVYMDFGFGPDWYTFPVPTAHEYTWLSDTERSPVMTIKTSEVNGQEQVTSVEYLDDYQLSTAELKKSEISIYPNPTQDLIFIECTNEIETIELISSSGILLQSIKANTYNYMDISNLTSGVYFLRMKGLESLELRKIVKN